MKKKAAPRAYNLGRRADQQAHTRRRIVEAAVELHTKLGPAQTSISQIAELAGVQRHTFYAHFPDERSLLMACSGSVFERDPPPDPAPWRSVNDAGDRLRVGLREIYDWYERNAQVTALALRDAEQHATVREIMELRFGGPLAAFHQALGAKLNAKQSAMLSLALNFQTWRTLTREIGLKQNAAVSLMANAVETAR